VKANNFKKDIERLKLEMEDEKKCEKKISKMKDKEVQALIFDKYLRETNNAKEGNQSVAKFFAKSN
jgi:predicted SnoaL-like aldol condensation-catalyzing enzyme